MRAADVRAADVRAADVRAADVRAARASRQGRTTSQLSVDWLTDDEVCT